MPISRKNITVFTSLLLAGFLASSQISHAQQSDDKNRVAEPYGFRSLSPFKFQDLNVDPFKYKGDPVPYNGFLIWPNLTLQQEYNDNILATQEDAESDFATVLKPELTISADIGRHNFLAQLQSEIRRYWQHTNENVENYRARFQANLEAKRGFDIPIKISYTDGHLSRRDQKRANVGDLSEEPLRVKSFEAETGLMIKPNRLALTILGDYRAARLENAERISGGALIRDNRNLNAVKGTTRLSYDLSSGWSPFAQVEYAKENYINEAAGANSRDNNLIRSMIGTAFNYKGLVQGFLSAGYETRTYSDDAVDDADGVSLQGQVRWEPQAKTRFTLDLSRETYEDNIIIAGITETYAGLEMQHEIQKDLFGKIGLSYKNEDFNDVDRTDKTFETGASLVYILNPHLQFGADYTYATRDSSAIGLDLDNNIFMLRATAAW